MFQKERALSGSITLALGAILLLALIPILQRTYDAAAIAGPHEVVFTPISFIKTFDLGLHGAVAALRWVGLRSDMPLVPEGYEKLDYDLKLINDLDPKFAQPYYFSVIVLPVLKKHPHRLEAAVAVGKRGVVSSEPDWRIPFYLAAVYHIYLRDSANAAKYFDIAAHTPGVPETIRRFAISYGILPNKRENTKEIWIAIAAGAKDEETRTRAEMHVRHLELIEILESAVSAYAKREGKFPVRLEDLVSEGIIPEIPKSPFGLEFYLYEGGVVGIKPEKDS